MINVNSIATLARRHAALSTAASTALASNISTSLNRTPIIIAPSTIVQQTRWKSSSKSSPPTALNGESSSWKINSTNNPEGKNKINGANNINLADDIPPNERPPSTADPLSTNDTNIAQAYENRMSTGAGFNIHDGPVPINQTARAKTRADRMKSKYSKYGSLMDPFYVPKVNDQTHLIQGGTPCDPKPTTPYRLADYGEESVYTLILLRHGESEWNSQNRYTGWCDVNLTKRGEGEARAAGRLLHENGIEIDHAFTSVLKRASFTTNMCLNMARQHWVPVTKTWRLNERHYGALQGYNKDTAWQTLNMDQELVMEMRRSYATPPPPMDDSHPHWHGSDRRYSKLSKEQLEKSRAESLQGAAERIMPFFNSVIVPSLREGNRCLVVSHANTIRTLIKQIDNISDQDIKQLSIPTGIPLIYRLDKNLKPVDPNCELEFRYMVQPKGYTWATSRQHGFHGVYLGDLERLQDIQKKRDATSRWWQRIILRKIAKQVSEENNDDSHLCFYSQNNNYSGPNQILETKHLWYKLTKKMMNPEFANMLLLIRMQEYLESTLALGKHPHIPLEAYEKIVEEIHLNSAGEVIDPFVSLEDRHDREERQKKWLETLSVDMEEECLIK